jgi:hypothetical protein
VHHVDARKVVVDRLAPDGGVAVGQAAELVVLVLERVAVDGAQAHAEILGVPPQGREVVHLVPRDMEGDGWGEASEPVDGRGVRDLLVDRSRRPSRPEDLEPGAGVAVGP